MHLQINKFLKLLTIYIIITTMLISCSNGKIDFEGTTLDCVESSYLPLPPQTDILYSKEGEENEKVQLKNLNLDIFKKIKPATLINTSSSKIISFTVKIESNKNSDSSTESHTQIVKLNPGEEFKLGCNMKVSIPYDEIEQKFYPDSLKVTEYNYTIVGELIIRK